MFSLTLFCTFTIGYGYDATGNLLAVADTTVADTIDVSHNRALSLDAIHRNKAAS